MWVQIDDITNWNRPQNAGKGNCTVLNPKHFQGKPSFSSEKEAGWGLQNNSLAILNYPYALTNVDFNPSFLTSNAKVIKFSSCFAFNDLIIENLSNRLNIIIAAAVIFIIDTAISFVVDVMTYFCLPC